MLLQPLHNESSLLEQVALGSEAAFRRLYDVYSGLIYSVALQHLKQQALAEDVVQTVFLKVWEQRETLQTVRSFSPWLYTLCRNTIIGHLRKMGSQQNYRSYIKGCMMPCAESPETTFIRRDLQSLIQHALEELSPQQRLAFQLQRDEGLSYEDIAAQMGIATNTVKVHLYKANQCIRHYLQLHGVDTVAVMFVLFLGW